MYQLTEDAATGQAKRKQLPDFSLPTTPTSPGSPMPVPDEHAVETIPLRLLSSSSLRLSESSD